MLYHKIPNAFMRDSETKKITEEYSNPSIKYLADLMWIWTEKIDGMNIRIMWDGHKVSYGGRTERAQLPPELVAKLDEYFGGRENEELFEKLFGETEVILFGEGYGGKIQAGKDYGSEDFILFDVAHKHEDGRFRYSSFSQHLDEVCETFKIKRVQPMIEGSIQLAKRYVKESPKSLLGDRVIEGLVGTPLVPLYFNGDSRIIVKIKVADFVE